MVFSAVIVSFGAQLIYGKAKTVGGVTSMMKDMRTKLGLFVKGLSQVIDFIVSYLI